MPRPPLFPASARLRRLILTDMVATCGSLHLSRRLCRALGLRRRDFRAEIAGWIDDGLPMAWLQANWLVWRGEAERIVLHPSQGEVTTLIAALRAVRQGCHDRSMLSDAAELLHAVMADLSPAARARHLALAGGDLSLLPPILAPDGKEGSPVRATVLTALRDERVLHILYTAADGARTARAVWPTGQTHHGSCLLAFCTLRKDFRTFRIDAIAAPEIGAALPRPRAALLADWRRHDPAGAGRWDPDNGEMIGAEGD